MDKSGRRTSRWGIATLNALAARILSISISYVHMNQSCPLLSLTSISIALEIDIQRPNDLNPRQHLQNTGHITGVNSISGNDSNQTIRGGDNLCLRYGHWLSSTTATVSGASSLGKATGEFRGMSDWGMEPCQHHNR